MRRRELMLLLGGALGAIPTAATAQGKPLPLLGFLSSRAPTDSARILAAFRDGLSTAGYVEGRNVAIEFRWAEGQYDRLPALAADLVARQVAVLVSVGGEPAALAAKAATSTIPTVFAIGGDPVKIGLATSTSRPGGNATGVSNLTSELEGKRLGLLHEIVPNADVIGVLVDAKFQPAEAQTKALQEAAAAIGQRIVLLHASSDAELEVAFGTLLQQGAGGFLVAAGPFFDTRIDRIVSFAAQHRLAAIYHIREFAFGGGLMSYGIDLAEAYRQVGSYTGRILKGANPAELPVVQSVKFESVINLKAARALGLTLPQVLMAQADELIE
jgi:putative ABC transport system substrate-binding protein